MPAADEILEPSATWNSTANRSPAAHAATETAATRPHFRWWRSVVLEPPPVGRGCVGIDVIAAGPTPLP
jgi:hypothetical protein